MQIGEGVGAGADRIIQIGLRFGDRASFSVLDDLLVANAITVAFDDVLPVSKFERIIVGGTVALSGRDFGNRRQIAAHRMAVIAVRLIAVAAGAGLVTHILDVGPDIAKRRLISQAWIVDRVVGEVGFAQCGGRGPIEIYESGAKAENGSDSDDSGDTCVAWHAGYDARCPRRRQERG